MQTLVNFILYIIFKVVLYFIMLFLVINIFYIVSLPFHYFSTSQGVKSYSKEGTISDAEGNVYQTITMDGKEWTTQNLRSSKFNDGRLIFHATNFNEWDSANQNNIPAWTTYNFDTKGDEKYGKIYNYAVIVDSIGIAPIGWNIPTFSDYFNFLNSNKIAANIFTSDRTYPSNTRGNNDAEYLRSHKQPWGFDCDQVYALEKYFPIDKGTNESGFSALPGGYIAANFQKNQFTNPLTNSGWWAKNNSSLIIFDHEAVSLGINDFKPGFYIRLIK